MLEAGWSLMSPFSLSDIRWSILMPAPTWLLLLGLSVALLSLWLKSLQKSPLSKIPGPHLLALINARFKDGLLDDFHVLRFCKNLMDTYGGICKVQHGISTVVCVSKPEYLQAYYTSKENVNKGFHYADVRDTIGDCLFVAGGAKWSKLRELAITTFFTTPADSLIAPMVSEADWLVKKLREKADGKRFACEPLMIEAQIRALNETMLGEPIESKYLELIRLTPHWGKISVQRFFNPLYYFDIPFQMSSTWRTVKKNAHEFRTNTVEKIIRPYRARLQEYEKKEESIPNIYIYKLLANQSNLSDEALADEFNILFIAAFDATAGALGYALQCLGMHPELQQRVLEEDDAIQEKLRGMETKANDLPEYEYLDRFIRESLRMFPQGPLITRETSVDSYMGKYLIPKGTNVVALQILCNYDEEVFENPYQFDPDRFLPENIAKIPEYGLNTFSSGPRSCLGAKYAMMSMKVFLAAIVRNFEIMPGYSSLKETLKNSDTALTLKEKNEHPIRLIPRVKK